MPINKSISREDIFRYSAAVILATAALAKLWMVVTKYPITRELDPLFGLSFKAIFCVGIALEGGCAWLLLSDGALLVKRLALVFLCTLLVVYRLGLWWLDYHLPCSCLGVLPDWLGMSRPASELLTQMLLAYLTLGSVLVLAFGRRAANAAP